MIAGLTYVARPPEVPAAGPSPVLLLLHGYGADEQDLLPLADALDPRLYVVSARAPVSLGGGFAWYPLGQTPDGALVPDHAVLRRSLETLTRFVEALSAALPIDASQLFIVGFSQGAVMASALLLSRPEVSRGTVMLSGYLPLDVVTPNAPDAARGRPVFVGHGTEDPLISIEAGRLSRDYLEQAGVDLTYREYPIGHYIGPDELADVGSWLTTRIG